MESQRSILVVGGPDAADQRALPDHLQPHGSPIEPPLRFRQFQVVPGARVLLSAGEPVELGSRAFDLLVILLQSKGRIVSKTEIFKHVWPTTVVEESNLRFQMGALRTALGADRDAIKTIPGRGYMLVADGDEEAPVMAVQSSPRDEAFCKVADKPPVALPIEGPDRGTPTSSVVVIDDDHGVREALEGFLRSTGLSVDVFESVPAYLSKSETVQPACFVLDVWLPGVSGLDFFEGFAAEPKHPPVIFISGHADIHMSVRAMKAGAVEFLTKPVRHQDLLDAVHAAIASNANSGRSAFVAAG